MYYVILQLVLVTFTPVQYTLASLQYTYIVAGTMYTPEQCIKKDWSADCTRYSVPGTWTFPLYTNAAGQVACSTQYCITVIPASTVAMLTEHKIAESMMSYTCLWP